MKILIALSIALCLGLSLQAQNTDSLYVTPPAQSSSPKKSIDAGYLQRLNTRGNLFIAGGVGLAGAGSYLVYQGTKIYSTEPPACPTGNCDTEEQKRTNQRQGTIYMAVGGTAIAGGIVLTALGAKAKVDFKRAKKYMSMNGGIKPDGSLYVAFRF